MEKIREISASGKSSVYSLFHAQVRRNRDAIAIEYQKNTWSYGTLDEEVRRLASVFTKINSGATPKPCGKVPTASVPVH